MQRLLFLFIFFSLIPSFAHGQGLITLFDFNGSFQGWEIAEGSQYGDLQLYGGNMLASWIGWDRDNWKPQNPPLPAGAELKFQSSYLGDYSLATEFLADVIYCYSLPSGSNLPLQARLYLLTEMSPIPHFGSWTDPPDVSYWPNSNSFFQHFGEWTTLSSEQMPNLISMSTHEIHGLNNIQAIGVSFRSSVAFRGKVKIDNIRMRVHPIPEPATLILLGIGLGILAGLKRFRKKAAHS